MIITEEHVSDATKWIAIVRCSAKNELTTEN